MRIYISVLFIFILFSLNETSAQWVQQTFNFNRNVTCVKFIDTLTGFFIFETEVMKTTDGGITFNTIYSSITGFLRNIYYLDGILIIVGPELIKSTDLGNTFEIIDWPLTPTYGFFINSNTGWIINNTYPNDLWKTTDGGNSLTMQNISISPEKIWFTDVNNGFATPNDVGDLRYKYARTTDGGTTWTLHSIREPDSSFADLRFTDLIFYNNNRGYIDQFLTTDAGASWTTYDGYHRMYFAYNFNVTAVYDRYRKYFDVSYDSGATWQRYFKPTGLSSVIEPVDSSIFIYGDQNGAIYKSYDRGTNWTCLTFPSFWLGAGFFLNDSTGWVSGSGDFLKTTNGGNSWVPIFTPLTRLAAFTFLNEYQGFGVDQNYYINTLVKTTDGGYTWDSILTLRGEDLGAFAFYDSTFGYGVTNNSYFYTTDGGTTWNIDSTSGAGGRDIYFPDRDTGYITGTIGYKTTDGGATWQPKTSLSGRSIYFINSQVGWKSRDYLIWRTTDGGENFTLVQDHVQSHQFIQLKFFDENNGVLSDNEFNEIWFTSDAGYNWMTSLTGFSRQYFRNKNLGWAYGDYAIIYKYSLPVPVEFLSFTAAPEGGSAKLTWSTATEKNNRGFEILRRNEKQEFQVIGFIPGAGTTTEIQHYSFTDAGIPPGRYFYKLIQWDYDGTKHQSSEIEVELVPYTHLNLTRTIRTPSIHPQI